jgi:hypothetical protein
MNDELNKFDDFAQKNHDKLYCVKGFWEKIKDIREGLKLPIDTGEYKYAKSESDRLLSSGFTSVILTSLIVALLSLFAFSSQIKYEEPTFEVTVMEPEEVDIPIEEITPPEEFEPVEVEIEVTDVVAETVTEVFTPEVMENNPTETSVKPVDITAVAFVKSPMVLKNLFANRSPGQRGAALAAFGAPEGTENAVLKALRWLKANQNPDGSWNMGAPETAMTGLALMCFLAHGETPQSEEFGHTVEYAIKYLVSQQKADGNFNKTGGHHVYGNAIANYALCEAYAMTRIVLLKDICDRGIKVIVDGQQAGGTWDYGYSAGPRADTSVMAWQAQALKAAYIAGCSVEGLSEAIEKAVKGFESMQGAKGGFGYISASDGPLVGAAVLSMQLLDSGGQASINKGLEYMYDWTMDWDGKKFVKKNPIYHWYYITQAKFHEGGPAWNSWNDVMSPTLIEKQFDDGHWEHPNAHEKSPVYSTTLACLMLEVYYRHLPTFKNNNSDAEHVADPKDPLEAEDPEDEIMIRIL